MNDKQKEISGWKYVVKCGEGIRGNKKTDAKASVRPFRFHYVRM